MFSSAKLGKLLWMQLLLVLSLVACFADRASAQKTYTQAHVGTSFGRLSPYIDDINPVLTIANPPSQSYLLPGISFEKPAPIPYVAHVDTPTYAYTVIDLGNLPGGTSTEGYGVNNSGQVTGASYVPNPNAFLSRLNGGLPLINLGTLGGIVSYGYGINGSGQVVGEAGTSATDAKGNEFSHAFLSRPNGGFPLIDLGTLGGSSSTGRGVNVSGQVAGAAATSATYADGSPIYHAFLSRPNGGLPLINLGTLGGSSSLADAVNDSGQVTGAAGTSFTDVSGSSLAHAFLSGPNGALPLDDLGTFIGGTSSYGFGVNNNGQVVGESDTIGGGVHPFLSGLNGDLPLTDLGTLGGPNGLGLGINNNGQVVGYADTSAIDANGYSIHHAFLYQNGMMTDLNSLVDPKSGWTFQIAYSISDTGYITGSGRINGSDHAFLLTPIAELTIDHAKMSDSHTLEVDVTTRSGNAASTNNSVEISLDLNGKQLDKSVDSSLYYAFPDNTQGTQTHAFSINLSNDKVPRFKSNQKFDITASAQIGTSQSSTKSTAVILLPMVLVPGIAPDQTKAFGGFGSFPSMYEYLEDESVLKLGGKHYIGQGYVAGDDSTQTNPYPTLFTLSYDRNYATFAQGAANLYSLCTTISQKTYSDSVCIAGHSKGGLVARQFIDTLKNPLTVAAFVMCETPNCGSLWAELDVTTLRTIGDYRNLYPLWPWLNKYYSPTCIQVSPNTELAKLNAIPLPPNVPVTLIWSGSIGTPYIETQDKPSQDDPLPITTSDISGDFIVPAFSQLGIMFNPNTPNAPQKIIPAFQNANITRVQVTGSHATGLPLGSSAPGGFDIPAVQATVLSTGMSGI